MIDLLILAAISLLLGIRLFTLLGKGNVHKIHKHKNVRTCGEADQYSNVCINEAAPKIKDVELKLEQAKNPLAKLKILDSKFNIKDFSAEIKKMYKEVLEAYAKGDTHALSKIANIEIMRKFAYPISVREENKYTCEISVDSIKGFEIDSVEISNLQAHVSVTIDAELVRYIEDAHGKVVSGNKTKVAKVRESWVLYKDFRSSTKHWQLIKTGDLFA